MAGLIFNLMLVNAATKSTTINLLYEKFYPFFGIHPVGVHPSALCSAMKTPPGQADRPNIFYVIVALQYPLLLNKFPGKKSFIRH